MLNDRLRRKSTSKKENLNKSLEQDVSTEILSYEEFHCKSYTRQNENSLDSLASNLSYN